MKRRLLLKRVSQANKANLVTVSLHYEAAIHSIAVSSVSVDATFKLVLAYMNIVT